MRKRASVFGTAIWLTKDGEKIRAENHLENLVQRYFDLDWFKSQFRSHMEQDYVTREQLEEMQDDPTFDPSEPGAPEVISTKELQVMVPDVTYIEEEMTPLQIGEIPTIAERFERNGLPETARAIMDIATEASSGGFETVIRGEEQPYHFAFKRGDIRIRFFRDSFVAELDARHLNRTSAGRIIDVFFSMTGGNAAKVPPSFGLDLIDFSGSEPNTRSLVFDDMNEFFSALSRFKRTAKKSTVEKILRFATAFYQRVVERT